MPIRAVVFDVGETLVDVDQAGTHPPTAAAASIVSLSALPDLLAGWASAAPDHSDARRLLGPAE